MVSLRDGNTFDLWGFLPTGYNTASPKYCHCQSLEEIKERLEEWFEDPEIFAMTYMGWIPSALNAKPKAAPAGRAYPATPVRVIDPDDFDFS